MLKPNLPKCDCFVTSILYHRLDDVTRIRQINSRYSINNKLMPNNNHQGNKQKKRTMSTFRDIEMIIEDLKK